MKAVTPPRRNPRRSIRKDGRHSFYSESQRRRSQNDENLKENVVQISFTESAQPVDTVRNHEPSGNQSQADQLSMAANNPFHCNPEAIMETQCDVPSEQLSIQRYDSVFVFKCLKQFCLNLNYYHLQSWQPIRMFEWSGTFGLATNTVTRRINEWAAVWQFERRISFWVMSSPKF